MTEHRFILEPYKGPASRHRCPVCGQQRKFTRYLDTHTGDRLPDHVGRCDREDKCGYHFTPKQHFGQVGNGTAICWTPSYIRQRPLEPEKPVVYLSAELVIKSRAPHEKNNFTAFLVSLFGQEVTRSLVEKYFIGTSRHWPGATVFWQVDIDGRVRQAKVIPYNPKTGKRIKDKGAYFAGKDILGNQEANLQQCFFGEHLLAEYLDATVGIVESEKTAVIASVYFPRLVWIATGGKNGARWTDRKVCRVLNGRDVIIFPDLQATEQWKEKAREVKRQVTCNILVSELLEQVATQEQREQGYDLADYLLQRDDVFGWALSEHGYPVFWDCDTVDAGAG